MAAVHGSFTICADVETCNPVIHAEVSVRYRRIEDLDDALARTALVREAIPFEAAFLAGKAYLSYLSY